MLEFNSFNGILTISECHSNIGGTMQKDFTNEILELIRRMSSSLPKDVEERLRQENFMVDNIRRICQRGLYRFPFQLLV